MFEPYNYLKQYYHFPEVKKLEPIKIKMITPNKINISNHKSNIDIITAKEIPIKNHQSYIPIIEAKEKSIEQFNGFSKDKIKTPAVKTYTSDIDKFYGAYNKSLPEVMRDRLQTDEGIPNDFNRRQRQMASDGSKDLQEIDNDDDEFEKEYKNFMNTYETRRKDIMKNPLMTRDEKYNELNEIQNFKTNIAPKLKVDRLKPVIKPVIRPVIRPNELNKTIDLIGKSSDVKNLVDKNLKKKAINLMKSKRNQEPNLDEYFDTNEPDDDFEDDEKDKERKRDDKNKKNKEDKDKKDKKNKQNELTLHKMHQQYQLKKALQLINKRQAFDKMKLTDADKEVIRKKHNEEDKKRHQELNKLYTPGKTANDMQEDTKKYNKVFEIDNSIADLLKQSDITDEEKAKEYKRKQEEFLSNYDEKRKQLKTDTEAITLFNELTKDITNLKTNIKDSLKYKKAYEAVKPLLEKGPALKLYGSIKNHLSNYQFDRINEVKQYEQRIKESKNEPKPKTSSYVNRDASFFNTSPNKTTDLLPTQKSYIPTRTRK